MELHLEDLIDVPLFQTIQDKLNEVYSFPSAIIDNEGRILTATAWQDVCTKFHRGHPECERECRKSDLYILEHIHEGSPAVTYRCPHGLVDNATPIVIDGKHVANFFTGQFFLEPPDLAFFEAQAARYGFDAAAYLEAVKRVPIWPMRKLEQYLDFIKGFVEILASIGHKNLRESEARRLLEEKESALQERNVLNQQIVESAEEGIVIHGMDLRYQLWNPFMERLTGMPARDVVGRLPVEVLPFLEKVGVLARVGAALRGRKQPTIEFPFELPNGRSGWASDTCAPLYGRDGSVIGAITTVHDITENKRNESALLKMQNLQSLGTLAGGIAHDFNNVLTGIVGSLSLLQAGGCSEQEASELVGEALKATTVAQGLARQLLTFAAGGVPLVAVVDLVPVIRDAAVFSARGSSARCVFELGDRPLTAKVDKDQIAQVVQNLVLNAVQAMPQGGTITVQAAECELAEAELPPLAAGHYVRIVVSDQGEGIREQDLPRLFDPYFTTKARGRGLGLAMCHSIVRRHGGHIAAAARPGAGAMFTVHLPRSSPAEARTAGGPSPSAPAAGRVLVLDDDDRVARVLRRMLERLGYEVKTVADGTEAVAAYRSAIASGCRFDLVIADLTIAGGLGGRQAVAQLKLIDPAVRAVVSSGYANDPVLSGWADHGFVGVLPKPYLLEDLSRVVREALRQTHPPER